jgi:hypothetical protein
VELKKVSDPRRSFPSLFPWQQESCNWGEMTKTQPKKRVDYKKSKERSPLGLVNIAVVGLEAEKSLIKSIYCAAKDKAG